MHAPRGRTAIALLSCVAVALSVRCATTTAPHAWLPRPSAAEREAFGGWMSVRYSSGGAKTETHGELIAVQADSVFVLTAGRLAAIPTAAVSRAKLTAYDSRYEALAGWTLVGTLSTPSHGWFGILSAPIWLLTGTVSTAARSHEPQVKHPPTPWEEFNKYARFPQGLPAGLDRRLLRPKPTVSPEPRHTRERVGTAPDY